MAESYLSAELRAGLDAARQTRKRGAARLRLRADGAVYPVLRVWKTGFALERDTAPRLRGFVDLYDDTRHVSTCLIVASAAEGDETIYEFKRNTQAADAAPVDFARDPDAPAALIGP